MSVLSTLSVRDWGARFWASNIVCDLSQPGNPFRPALRVVLPHLVIDGAALQALAQGGRGRRLDLVIPAQEFLVRELRLPRLTADKAAAAIGVNLRQTLPGGGKGLVWRHVRKARNREGDLHAIYLMKDEALARLRTAADRAGFARLRVRADVPGLPVLLDTGAAGPGAAFWRLATLLGVLGLLALSAALPALQAMRVERANAALADEVAALQDQAVAARSTADSAQTTAAALAGDLARMADGRRALDMLASLAAALPDDTWVPELTFADGRAYMAFLTTGKVPDVLARLDDLDWSGSVRLDGPILPDPVTGQNRFQVVIDTLGSAAP